MPSGFVGTSTLAVRLKYTTSGSTWNWVDYRAPDPDARYFTKSSGDTNTTNIATKMPLAGGTFTGAVNFDDDVVVKGDSTNGSGKITLNCENNSHGVKIKGPPHSAAATYTLTLPNNTGTNGQALTTNGSGVLSFADIASSIITQTDFAYKPSSNKATLAGPSVTSTTPSGLNEYIGNPNSSGNTKVRFEKSTNTTFYNLINQLSSGDSIDVTYDNLGTIKPLLQLFLLSWITQLIIVVYGELTIGTRLGSFATGTGVSFSVTSSQIVNGVDPIYNNQVLRYKTATNKWTVDDAEVISICDGGNFDNGSSLVTTTTTFDGGSF